MLPQIDAADLRALRVFDVIAEVGSFAAAQERLNVNESTISSQISRFERRIGFKLCTRGRSGLQLTSRGKIVLEEFRKLDQSMDMFRQTLNSLENTAVGSLRVGTLEQTINETGFSFVELFNQFINHAPSVHLNVVQNIQSELYQAVLDERLDVALGAFNVENRLTNSVSLYTEYQHIYCGSKHIFFEQSENQITHEMLRQEKWVSRGYQLAEFSLLPINTEQITATSANLEAVIAIIQAGQHLGYLPEHFAARFEKAGKIRPLFAKELTAELNFCLISKSGRRETLAVKLFRDLALAQLDDAANNRH